MTQTKTVTSFSDVGLTTISSRPAEDPQNVEMPTTLPERDADHFSAISNSQHHAEIEEGSRVAPRQAQRRYEGVRAALGPVHPLKVSKACRKSRSSPKQRPRVCKLPPDVQQSSLELDIPVAAPSAPPISPRRSRRLREVEPETAPDISRANPAGPCGDNSRLKPRPITSGPKSEGSANPHRVSKARPSTTRRRAR
jgi:hypothetical protein